MAKPFTRKILEDWAGPKMFRDGKTLFENAQVVKIEYEHPIVQGQVTRGNRNVRCSFKILPDGSVDNLCPCKDNRERGLICAHVIAVGLEYLRRTEDPDRFRKRLEEARRAKRLAAISEESYLKRVPANSRGAVPAVLRLTLDKDWVEQLRTTGMIPVCCEIRFNNKSVPVSDAPRETSYTFSEKDESILYVLEDIAEGAVPHRSEMSPPDFINLMNLCAGKPIFLEGADQPITVNAATVRSSIMMDLDRENGELILFLETPLAFLKPGEFPLYVVSRKEVWAYGGGHFWRVENILPQPLHGVYTKPVVVARKSVPRFMNTELPLLQKLIKVNTEITSDLFTTDPAAPQFQLLIKGSPASLSATLYALYEEHKLVAARNDKDAQFAIPDPEDLLRYHVRNIPREQQALAWLKKTGLIGVQGDDLEPIVGCREVMNFLGSDLPALRRLGWQVEFEGKVKPFVEDAHFAAPVVHVDENQGNSWFEIGFSYEDGEGENLDPAEIQRALRKGESFLSHKGRTIFLDAGAIDSLNTVFQDCASGEGSGAGLFRMDNVYAAYVKSSLDAIDGVDVEANAEWLKNAERHNRTMQVEAVDIGARLEAILRPYQKEGVNWLRFLEKNHFGGILADDMGLGKTLQTLTWLSVEREREDQRNKPTLVVCPTSLVDNWAEEAQRFVPELSVITIFGSKRMKDLEEIPEHDLVITSYALLRRDIDHYLNMEFTAVVLDEAQHIKNRSTQNAIAVKKIQARHKLVLTGTPIENSVSDLWSIMDFLMPGYLGRHDVFRANIELPISRGGPEAEDAQRRLRRKLQPFLLRRMKKDVAKDLPPKIERVITCSLTADQQMVYKELLNASRRKICNMVEQQGFNRSRMEVLKTLLRLRQTCCHLDLLKLPGLNSKNPSTKLSLFQELLNEAMDGGHRMLVFSQFTTMLGILREYLEEKEIKYCYLDGSTKNRLTIVKQFNMDRTIPVFLISLKAGGTGLNLVGADMVLHFDPWWNPAVEDQATDRAYRIGQTRTVYSMKLITKGTVEEKVLEMQRKKKSVIDATLSTDEKVMDKLTWNDVQELLTL